MRQYEMDGSGRRAAHSLFPENCRGCISNSFVQRDHARHGPREQDIRRRQQHSADTAPAPTRAPVHPDAELRITLCSCGPSQNGSRFPVDSASYPRHSSLQSKCRKQSACARRARPALPRPHKTYIPDSNTAACSRSSCSRNARSAPLRDQVQRQFVQQTIKTLGRKCRGIVLPRHSSALSHQACHPLQPRRIVY